MNDDFGVGVRAHAMAVVFELGAEFEEVVNLAVENDPGATVFVEDRLMASREVDDAEAAHAEASAIGDVDSLIVGAAIHDLFAHVVHERLSNVALASCAHHPGDSTHGLVCPLILSRFYPFDATGIEPDLFADFSPNERISTKRLKR